MIEGRVDRGGQALLDVGLRRSIGELSIVVSCWIETGFTGELVLPRSLVDHLKLPQSGTTTAILADGVEVILPIFECYADWFGQPIRLEVVANDGQNALLGVGMLLDHDLYISYRTGKITLN
jgi:clan AA aspartic protease